LPHKPVLRLPRPTGTARAARAASIWDHGDSSHANEEAIKALRAAIVTECQDLLHQHSEQIGQCKAPQDPIAVAGAQKALEKAPKSMEALKR
jgi:hypothetical protein